jgi:hypothetical protein
MKTAELSSRPVITYDRRRMRSAQLLSMSCFMYLEKRVECRELLAFASNGLCSFRAGAVGSSGAGVPFSVPYPCEEVMATRDLKVKVLMRPLKFYNDKERSITLKRNERKIAGGNNLPATLPSLRRVASW